VALIETTGRVTGKTSSAAAGFVEEPDGTLLVAAGSEYADWALNLRAHPVCRVRVGEQTAKYTAQEVDEGDFGRAVSQLILKYGTPAERLGRGPVFRLVSTEPTGEPTP